MSLDAKFTKENFDAILRELGKEYRKLCGRKGVDCELVLVGGASILAKYSFRAMTNDMDFVSAEYGILKDAINRVGEKFSLERGWLNSNFTRTKSFSPYLRDVSRPYGTFSNCLHVRIVDSEYMIAMKLMSGRRYKNDISDIIGIISEHKASGNPLSVEQVQNAVCRLYGSWDVIKQEMKAVLEDCFQSADPSKLYEHYRKLEERTKEKLLDFEEKYPSVANEDNTNSILAKLLSEETER